MTYNPCQFHLRLLGGQVLQGLGAHTTVPGPLRVGGQSRESLDRPRAVPPRVAQRRGPRVLQTLVPTRAHGLVSPLVIPPLGGRPGEHTRDRETVMVGDWETWWDSWLLHLIAIQRRPKTIAFYERELGRFSDMVEVGPLEVGRDDVRAWVRALVDGGLAPNTVNNRLICVKSFYTWLVKEGEIPVSPAGNVSAPKHQGPDPAVLSDDEFDRLLSLTQGQGPYERRNRAILLVLESSGCRAGELVSMADKGCDLHNQRVDVEGKGGQWRPVPISARAAEAVDRYRRVRRQLRGTSAALWWGKKGDLTTKGLDHLLDRLGAKAEVDVHAHRFRHRFSHRWLDAGGSEAGLQVAAGWSSVAMPRKYGRALSVQRMLDEHSRLFG